jgi:hypothetical protein
MTSFIGTNDSDTIAPGSVTPGVQTIGPDATPGDGDDLIIARGGDDFVAGGKGEGNDALVGGAGVDKLDLDGFGADEEIFAWRTG